MWHKRKYWDEKTIFALIICALITGYLIGDGFFIDYFEINRELFNITIIVITTFIFFMVWIYSMKWWFEELDTIFYNDQKIPISKFLIWSGYIILAFGIFITVEYLFFYVVLIIMGAIMLIVGLAIPDHCRVCNVSEEHRELKKVKNGKFYCVECIKKVSEDLNFINSKTDDSIMEG